MARPDSTTLAVSSREPEGSRATRRLRRAGQVPGVVYGGGDEPVPFAVDARELRQALAHAGAVLDLSIDGGSGTPVVLKDQQRHPVRGETVHIDLLRVRLDRPIHAVVPLELDGAEESPGVKEGGVLDQITRELNIEALPTEIPDAIRHDVSALEMNDTITLSVVAVPPGVTLLDDPDETVVATLSPPRLEVEPEEELETETELVGEDGEPIEGEEAAGEGDEAPPAEGEGGGGGEE
jgi:large subunit ribosomal protein L25